MSPQICSAMNIRSVHPFAILFTSLLFLLPGRLFAQAGKDNPGAYITSISSALEGMNKSYMRYMSAAAHSRRAKKIEKLRLQTIESIIHTKANIGSLPPYKDDNSLRKSALDYVQLCYKVFNDDYAHIVNLEEIAEQSYDAMEAYILLQEKTNEKVQEAVANMSAASAAFAGKYNVNLVETKNELTEKMMAADKLNHYRNQVYLCFFKCHWQEGQIIDAINHKNLNNMEQARNALASYAKGGMAALDSLQNFEGDTSLAAACKQALGFYKNEAENELPRLTDFYLKQDHFEKIQKAFNAKASNARTQQEIDAYNKSVADINNATDSFNKTNAGINNARTQVLRNWNQAEKTFVDHHMPHYKP